MLQLENRTPFKATIAVLPDRAGVDTLYTIVKATLTLRPKLALADEQVAVTMADEYYGEPETSSLRAISELHIGKLGTDVLVVGNAHAEEGRATSRMMVSLIAAQRRKDLVVMGQRFWYDGSLTPPQPFETMPLVWERAFGGVHRIEDQVLAEERNPIGCGFTGKRSAAEVQGQPVPSIEDPATPLQHLGQRCTPVCFAPVAPAWLPRRSYAGTYDANWQRTRAPYLPDDFDSRFFQSSGAGFAFDEYFVGGEPIALSGMTPDEPIRFNVPASPLSVEVTMAGAVEKPTANLETLWIAPDENRLCMTWRAAVPCDRKTLKVEKIVLDFANRPRT